MGIIILYIVFTYLATIGVNLYRKAENNIPLSTMVIVFSPISFAISIGILLDKKLNDK
jgi:hypothetical protein